MKNRILTLLAIMCVAIGAQAQTSYFNSVVQVGTWYDTVAVQVTVSGQVTLPYTIKFTADSIGLDTTITASNPTTITVFKDLPFNLSTPLKVKITDAAGEDSMGANLQTIHLEGMFPEVYPVTGGQQCRYFFKGTYMSKDLPSTYWWKITGSGVAALFEWESQHLSMPQGENLVPNDTFDLSAFGAGWYNAYLITEKPYYGRDTSEVSMFSLSCTATIITETNALLNMWTAEQSVFFSSPQTGTLRLYGISGQLLSQHNVTDQQRVELPPLANGVYCIELATKQGAQRIKFAL